MIDISIKVLLRPFLLGLFFFSGQAHSTIELPSELPKWKGNEQPSLQGHDLTIIPEIQNHMQLFLENRNNPVAGLMLAEVETGRVLAFIQGAKPSTWGAQTHTNLHTGFPAASLFKTVVAASTLESTMLTAEDKSTLDGGCGHVSPRSYWMRNSLPLRRSFQLNLRRAYGSSCNGFFAKLAVTEVGLGPILSMANRLGWDNVSVDADFYIEPSPILPPDPLTSSTHQVGRFAAGFGNVGLSVAHATWQMLAIANKGKAKPLRISADNGILLDSNSERRIMSQTVATGLMEIMDATVIGGTAQSVFRSRRYRKFRRDFGGKTGTLTGYNPKGVTTWFTGIYPISKPKVVVAAVVILQDLWHIKAANLAGEAVLSYIHHSDAMVLAKAKTKSVKKH